jgi:hypothetical protein
MRFKIGVLLLVAHFAFGQPNLPVQIGPVSVPDEPVPIAGIEILVGGGLMAGLYSHFRRRKRNNNK